MGGHVSLNGLHVGIGPPPPGTLLMSATVVEVLFASGFPVNAAATIKASAEMRMACFIGKSPV